MQDALTVGQLAALDQEVKVIQSEDNLLLSLKSRQITITFLFVIAPGIFDIVKTWLLYVRPWTLIEW